MAKTYKFEALLKKLATTPMNREEITNFLISRSAGKLSYDGTYATKAAFDYWNSTLYGNRNRVGLLERFCRQNKDGRYQTIRKVERPFLPVRYGLNDDGTAVELANERRYWSGF